MVQLLDPPTLVVAPLDGDRELRRWYAEGGDRCVALTERGNLVEPQPTFDPVTYLLLATDVDFPDASRYAHAHGYRRPRRVDRPSRA